MAEVAAPARNARNAPPRDHEVKIAQNDVIRHGRDNAGHMRGILLNRHEAACIRRPGDKNEEKRQMAVSLVVAVFRGDAAEILMHVALCLMLAARSMVLVEIAGLYQGAA